MATIDGLFEHSVDVGTDVEAGDLAGRIWPIDDSRAPAWSFGSPLVAPYLPGERCPWSRAATMFATWECP
jgi:hypothetical protein